ncbi:hypothetical protein AGMMS50293_23880 [Spirochaetia bacterium]|nr:hypothetical protein AGMMS50293_23880 [Spirochaetia bacterium]
MVQVKERKKTAVKRATAIKKTPAAKKAKAVSLPSEKSLKAMAVLSEWDPAEYIEDKEDVIATLMVALAEGNMEELLDDIKDIARSKGMTQIAREMGKSREGLYRSIAPGGNPSFETVMKLLDLLGFRLTVERKPRNG